MKIKKKFFIFIFIFTCLINYPIYAADYNDYAIHGGDILSNINNKKIKILGNLLSLAGKFNLFSWEDPLICTINEGWFTDGLDCQTSDKLFNELRQNRLGLYLFYNKNGKRSIDFIPGSKFNYKYPPYFIYDISCKGLEFIFLGDLEGTPLSRIKRVSRMQPFEPDFIKLDSKDMSYINSAYLGRSN